MSLVFGLLVTVFCSTQRRENNTNPGVSVGWNSCRGSDEMLSLETSACLNKRETILSRFYQTTVPSQGEPLVLTSLKKR